MNDQEDDQEVCRVCRCEATEEEPLFYPCKCSGSIRYVHQNCLHEWLAHSKREYVNKSI
ncbi:RING-variant domain-containing protein [Phycomyces blakesleeanus]|uniref:RING-type E3 ubiquitin transferase n=1 Tax=Phycomyces blakesleeanus TaxID=4837 RepID=A0ABR3AQJ8_PHYBL